MDTFVIRIYPDSGLGRPGRIEHVASGSVHFFHSLDEIADLLTEVLTHAGREDGGQAAVIGDTENAASPTE